MLAKNYDLIAGAQPDMQVCFFVFFCFQKQRNERKPMPIEHAKSRQKKKEAKENPTG